MLIGATIFAVVLAEIIVRGFAFDWRLINKMLYYQKADWPSHEADPNPQIIFHLKPGTYDYGERAHGYKVHINAFGARGPERSATKPPGVFRIFCFGGSNVYGSGLNDDKTWPAQLEARLNRDEPGRYEVWNFGTSAYVPMQMVALAKKKAEEFKPDLIIFAVSNGGAPAFLYGASPAPFFNRHPQLWRDLFTPPDCLVGPKEWSPEFRLALVHWVRLYRLAAAFFAAEKGCTWVFSATHEARNVRMAREFFEWTNGRAKVCVFLYPGTMKKDFDYGPYYRGSNVPTLTLADPGMPPEYYDVHPPAYVMAWYADRLAEFFRQQKLLGE